MKWTWELEDMFQLKPIIWHNNAYWWVTPPGKRNLRLGIDYRQVRASINYLWEN